MTYLIRLATRPVKYGTTDRLIIRFTGVDRTVRDNGIWRTVEQVGVERSSVDVTYSKDETRAANGTRGLHPSYDRFRLLDRHQHLRVLAEPDERELADIDAEIDAVREQLGALRKRRATAVAAAWRRGAKVSISDLETPAIAAEEQRLQRQQQR